MHNNGGIIPDVLRELPRKEWARGMACPQCGSQKTAVLDCRPDRARNRIRRRRHCENGHRFTTYETVCLEDQDWSGWEI